MELFSSFFDPKTSDKGRMPFCGTDKYKAPLLGISVGLIYGVLEWWFDRFGEGSHRTLWIIHEAFDFVVPVTIGCLVGIGVSLFQKKRALTEALSTQNQNMRSRLLANTLLAHVLHEIRNPIHNLSALLEKSIALLPQSDREIAERNLKRLNDTAEQLKKINGPWDEISARQRTVFADWLRFFLNQSASSAFSAASIRYTEKIEPLIVHMHPFLLEQCFSILFQNAIQACSKKYIHPWISLSAKIDSSQHGFAVIEIRNSGALFPDSVLNLGGRQAIRSASGMGIGLLLARDTLENIGGALNLSNESSSAVVKVWIPAERLL